MCVGVEKECTKKSAALTGLLARPPQILSKPYNTRFPDIPIQNQLKKSQDKTENGAKQFVSVGPLGHYLVSWKIYRP